MNNNITATDPLKYGFLIQPSVKLHRRWFIEMAKLLGIKVEYSYPIQGYHLGEFIVSTDTLSTGDGINWTQYAEVDAGYSKPITINCIFEQHPDQQTLKKVGWVSELQENSSIIHVQYDLEKLQQGCLFNIPSGLDDGVNRLFRVVRITNSIVYPASMMCEIVPEYYDKYIPDINTHKNNSNMNVLNDEEFYHTWN